MHDKVSVHECRVAAMPEVLSTKAGATTAKWSAETFNALQKAYNDFYEDCVKRGISTGLPEPLPIGMLIVCITKMASDHAANENKREAGFELIKVETARSAPLRAQYEKVSDANLKTMMQVLRLKCSLHKCMLLCEAIRKGDQQVQPPSPHNIWASPVPQHTHMGDMASGPHNTRASPVRIAAPASPQPPAHTHAAICTRVCCMD